MSDIPPLEPAVTETHRRAAVEFQLMPSGKPVRIDLPADITEPEGFAMVEAVIQVIRQVQSKQIQMAKPRLLIPS